MNSLFIFLLLKNYYLPLNRFNNIKTITSYLLCKKQHSLFSEISHPNENTLSCLNKQLKTNLYFSLICNRNDYFTILILQFHQLLLAEL